MAAAGAMMIEAVLLHLTVRKALGIVLFVLADPLGQTRQQKVS